MCGGMGSYAHAESRANAKRAVRERGATPLCPWGPERPQNIRSAKAAMRSCSGPTKEEKAGSTVVTRIEAGKMAKYSSHAPREGV